MALATRIVERRTASAANRARQNRAEQRLDEIIKVAGIADAYAVTDRRGDLAVETHFARLYQLVDTDVERDAVVAAYMVWQRDEAEEEAVVRGEVDASVDLMKRNNPLFINGAWTPGKDGAA